MSIVSTEVESIHGGINEQRMIFYSCQDHLGTRHSYGPVITVDPAFDVNGFKPTVAAKVAASLATQEADRLLT